MSMTQGLDADGEQAFDAVLDGAPERWHAGVQRREIAVYLPPSHWVLPGGLHVRQGMALCSRMRPQQP